ncbi:PqqD family peptide modification chaperone [Nocardia fusca]|uniref:PqqD family peptide modification chaperone n=1 Tax=Nocardia fusca TaxID=941183 RepID=UPI00378BADDF
MRTEYGGVVLDLKRGDYWRLNPVGAEVFALLDGDEDIDPVDVITAKFDVDATTASRDITELIDHLRDLGLVVA